MDRLIGILLIVWIGSIRFAVSDVAGSSYGPPKNEETEVEIQQVEVYEVPWIGDQPTDSYAAPASSYDPPAPSYGPPSQQYGPPEEPPSITSTTEYPDLSTTVASLNSTNITESSTNKTARLMLSRPNAEVGQYYIYHPNGLLQKVTYSTEDNEQAMTYSARLKYKNVEPVRGPIYTYNPLTYVFSRISRK